MAHFLFIFFQNKYFVWGVNQTFDKRKTQKNETLHSFLMLQKTKQTKNGHIWLYVLYKLERIMERKREGKKRKGEKKRKKRLE